MDVSSQYNAETLAGSYITLNSRPHDLTVARFAMHSVYGGYSDGAVCMNYDLHLSPVHFPLPKVEVSVYFCEDSGLCHMQDAILSIPLQASETAQHVVTVSHQLQASV